MKIIANEHESAFTVTLYAESMQEAALLTRIGMNGKLDSVDAYVGDDGQFHLHTMYKKHRRPSGFVTRRR